MKYFVSIFFLCFCLSCLSAQENHFVFIQTDNNLPFYVFLNGKLYSSSASGYMIIPKLDDGSYNFSVGFAKNAFPEQGFEMVVDKKDLGFNLKNFDEKGWGLFNLQTMNVTMAGSTTPNEVSKAISEKEQPKDDFEPLVSFDKKSKEALAKAKKAADKPKIEEAVADNKPKEQPATPQEAETREDNTSVLADVKKVSESKDEDGVHLSFADNNGSGTDTIQVTIPSAKPSNENSVSTEETNNATAETNNSGNQTNNTDNNAATNSVASENNEAAGDSPRVSDINTDKTKKDTAKTVTNNNNTVSSNSHCNDLATDEDFIRLRKKMAMQTSDEKMIKEAKKVYRNKCFTTSQIKRLSTLFLSDEERYNFINVSYNFASDVSEYSTLQSEFIDPAFVSRFKAMLQ